MKNKDGSLIANHGQFNYFEACNSLYNVKVFGEALRQMMQQHRNFQENLWKFATRVTTHHRNFVTWMTPVFIGKRCLIEPTW